MKKHYLIDNKNENKRLNFQNTIDVYNLSNELAYFDWNKNHFVLDAGCGNGNVIEQLLNRGLQKIHGVDFSPERIDEVKKRFENQNEIEAYHAPLEQTGLADESYDRIICRYVYEHLTNTPEVTHELWRLLKPGGSLYIIEFDNIFFDFYTKNEDFNRQLLELKNKLPQDFGIARKLPQLLKQHQFDEVHWDAETFFFKGERLEMEYQNNEMRLTQGRDHLAKYFKTTADYDQFAQTYLQEMKDECNVLSTTKYLIKATKTNKQKLEIVK